MVRERFDQKARKRRTCSALWKTRSTLRNALSGYFSCHCCSFVNVIKSLTRLEAVSTEGLGFSAKIPPQKAQLPAIPSFVVYSSAIFTGTPCAAAPTKDRLSTRPSAPSQYANTRASESETQAKNLERQRRGKCISCCVGAPYRCTSPAYICRYRFTQSAGRSLPGLMSP